jgi:predicted alpha/beta-hydrolase family hydrolase
MAELLVDGPKQGPLFILAHGAGAPMDHEWMNALTGHLGEQKVRVVRFEFPYMARRRTDGKKPGPDRAPVLEATWKEVVAQVAKRFKVAPAELLIGGKSMGGRIASMVADELGVGGLVCLGYPFHPPGRPEKLRTAHLEALATDTVIFQGTRDSMGNYEEIQGYRLSQAIDVRFIEDGDHSLKPRKKTTGLTLDDVLRDVAGQIGTFAHRGG